MASWRVRHWARRRVKSGSCVGGEGGSGRLERAGERETRGGGGERGERGEREARGGECAERVAAAAGARAGAGEAPAGERERDAGERERGASVARAISPGPRTSLFRSLSFLSPIPRICLGWRV